MTKPEVLRELVESRSDSDAETALRRAIKLLQNAIGNDDVVAISASVVTKLDDDADYNMKAEHAFYGAEVVLQQMLYDCAESVFHAYNSTDTTDETMQ